MPQQGDSQTKNFIIQQEAGEVLLADRQMRNKSRLSSSQAVMDKQSAAALGGEPIDWALASKQHAGYVDALSKIVDSVEVR